VFSGECFDNLKKTGLAIKTDHKEFDENMNLYLDLALLTMNNWTPNSAEIVKLSFENPNKTQKELAQKLDITQSNVSERIKRSGFDEIMRLENHYKKLIKKIWYS
jgi:DNA-directed RNA polymerase specialized sigma subunit